eukprot:COSAG03_NODE_613_length_6714_cov_4.286168_3_plen_82_part_00
MNARAQFEAQVIRRASRASLRRATALVALEDRELSSSREKEGPARAARAPGHEHASWCETICMGGAPRMILCDARHTYMFI